MRVLIINTSERTGGAAIAAGRLLEALKNNGLKAKMIVRDKQSDKLNVVGLSNNWFTVAKFIWERVVIWAANSFRRNNLFAVDVANTGNDITTLPEFEQADVIHLHWINQGMLSLKDIAKILKSGKSVVWTMHDMWPFTGICHHARSCENYETECHNCPFIYGGGTKRDLSFSTFKNKKRIYNIAPITFVGCSQWLSDKAAKSALIGSENIVTIPNPINTHLFKPKNKEEARRLCQLPQDKKLILFGSVKISDKRKGIDYFIESSHLLAQKHPELKDSMGIVVFGKGSELLKDALPFSVYSLDYVKDDHKLVLIYNAVDLYVTPSLEENLPNTIMEAMACGIPCVGFNVGGIPEMIDHLHNGYVAQYESAADLANGIFWTLKESEYPSLSDEAHRKVVTAYSEGNVAKRYIEVYNKITGNNA